MKHFQRVMGMILLMSLTACGTSRTGRVQPLPDTDAPEPTAESVQEAEPTAVPTEALTDAPTQIPPPTAPPTEEEPTMPTTESPYTEEANADVTYVRAVEQNDGTWIFYVTVEHPDTGWEDYADGWDVVLPDGTVIKPNPDSPFTRLLLHPHETEQPFTRSQSGIVIPDGVTQVTVRAHDLVDGWGGKEVVVDLTVESGENFQVERRG